MTEYNTLQFRKDTQALGITLSDEQIEQFLIYYEMLVEWNQVMNLTAITGYDDVMKDKQSSMRVRENLLLFPHLSLLTSY